MTAASGLNFSRWAAGKVLVTLGFLSFIFDASLNPRSFGLMTAIPLN